MAEAQSIQPLNTEWNRKANMLEGTGKLQVLAIKGGIIYFTWTDIERGTLYLQCEEGFFNQQFRVPKTQAEGSAEQAPVDLKKFKFKRYPFDVVKK